MVRFKLYNEAELYEIQLYLQEIVTHWASEWLVENVLGSCQVANSFLSLPDDFSRTSARASSPDHRVSLFTEASNVNVASAVISAELSSARLTEREADYIASECIESLLYDLSSRARSDLSSSSVQEAAIKGRGWVSLQFSINSQPFLLLLAPQLISHVVPMRSLSLGLRPNLESRKVAISKKKTVLRAMLGSAEISVGELQRLQKGDVLMLEKSFDQMISVETGAGVPVCLGHLGKVLDKRAVMIASGIDFE